MTDMCNNCVYRGYIDGCEADNCAVHDSWYVDELKRQIKEMHEIIEKGYKSKFLIPEIEEGLILQNKVSNMQADMLIKKMDKK